VEAPGTAAVPGPPLFSRSGVTMPGTELVLDRKYSLNPAADERATAAFWALVAVERWSQGKNGSGAFAQYRRALEWAERWEVRI
jgi:hypothetical protein